MSRKQGSGICFCVDFRQLFYSNCERSIWIEGNAQWLDVRGWKFGDNKNLIRCLWHKLQFGTKCLRETQIGAQNCQFCSHFDSKSTLLRMKVPVDLHDTSLWRLDDLDSNWCCKYMSWSVLESVNWFGATGEGTFLTEPGIWWLSFFWGLEQVFQRR